MLHIFIFINIHNIRYYFFYRLDEQPSSRWNPQLSTPEFQTLLNNLTAIKIRITFGEEGMYANILSLVHFGDCSYPVMDSVYVFNIHQGVVIWTTLPWSQLSWALAFLQRGWRSAVVRQVTKDSSVSAALPAIKDVFLDRVSGASASHVPVWEEAVILKRVRFRKQH